MVWDPLGTIGKAFWIGGGQWAGKTTVARLLAERHRLIVYRHDYPAAHSHYDRAAAAQARAGGPITEFDPEWAFVQRTPAQMADEVIAQFIERFDWALDDLRALEGPTAVVAEGWGLRPESVAGIGFADRMVVLAPTDQFRLHQLRALPRETRDEADAAGSFFREHFVCGAFRRDERTGRGGRRQRGCRACDGNLQVD